MVYFIIAGQLPGKDRDENDNQRAATDAIAASRAGRLFKVEVNITVNYKLICRLTSPSSRLAPSTS